MAFTWIFVRFTPLSTKLLQLYLKCQMFSLIY
jgi:hypothetical protein